MGLRDGLSDYPTPTTVDSRAASSLTGSVLNYAKILKIASRNVIALITDEEGAASPLALWGGTPPDGISAANSIVRRVGFMEPPTSQTWVDVSVGPDRVLYLDGNGQIWWTGLFNATNAASGIVYASKWPDATLPAVRWVVALYNSEIAVTASGDIWTLRALKDTSSGLYMYSDATAELVAPASAWKADYSSPIKDVRGSWYCGVTCDDLNWNVYILLEDGNMFGLGSNSFGQLCQEIPNNFTTEPYPLGLPPSNPHGRPTGVFSFAAGSAYFVALFNDTQTTVNAYCAIFSLAPRLVPFSDLVFVKLVEPTSSTNRARRRLSALRFLTLVTILPTTLSGIGSVCGACGKATLAACPYR